MGRNEESLDIVLNRYNRLLARYRDLEQQSTEKQDKWKELEKEFRINETLTRELCELILAKDPKEMVLGEEYAWSKLSTRDILQRSKTSFTDYNTTRTQLLRDIQQQSEERRIMVENLKIQIEQDRNAQKRLDQLRNEVPHDETTGEVQDEAPENPVDEKTKNRVNYSYQEAANKGDIALVQFNEEELEQAKSVLNSLHIFEEDKDVTGVGAMQQIDMATMATKVDLERSGAVISSSERKVQAIAREKKKLTQQTMQVDIDKIEKKMNPRRWCLLQAIGDDGLCEGAEIIQAALKLLAEQGDVSIGESGIRHELFNLANQHCIDMDNSVSNPLKSKFAIYTLSSIGQRLYTTHFDREPAISEKDHLIAEHDNLEHGFGIKYLKQILEATQQYTDVCMNRKTNTIPLGDGTQYIPDVVTTSQVKGKTFVNYYEYERGTHKQVDFNIKLNKMTKVTRILNIVVPNAPTAEALSEKTTKWIQSRGGAKQLSRIKVRITTLAKLNGHKDLHRDDQWMYVFDLKFGENPIERK